MYRSRQSAVHDQYKNVQVTTVDRGRLLLMMYDGAVKFLKQAKMGLETNDMAKFCKFLAKGQAIIAELMNTLDYEKGGKIARDLDRLYDFMLFYLTEANLYRDVKRVNKVIELVEIIYSAYREIIEGAKVAASGQTVTPTTQESQDKLGEAVRRVQLSL